MGSGGLTVKLIRFLMVVAFLGLSASAALADGVDPKVFTSGCTSSCDAEFLTPGNTTLRVTENFTCDDISGICTAADTVINFTGMPITSFTLLFDPTDSHDNTLSYSCTGEGFFTCHQDGPRAFTFSGASVCADPDDDSNNGIFSTDGDECGVVIHLTGTKSEGLFTGDTVGAGFSVAPEPSSALLLLLGLMAGLVSFKSFRSILA